MATKVDKAAESSRAARLPRDQRRAQLLDAAKEVFTSKGYHAAAMDDIAEAAGVSKPVLYQHFPSKLDLYLALLDSSCERLVEIVTEALASTDHNADRVVATMGAFYEFVSSSAGEFRFVFESDLTGEGRVQQRLWRVNDEIADAIAAVISEDTALPGARVQAAGDFAGRHRAGQRPLLGLRGLRQDPPGRGEAAGQQPRLARNQRLPADRAPGLIEPVRPDRQPPETAQKQIAIRSWLARLTDVAAPRHGSSHCG